MSKFNLKKKPEMVENLAGGLAYKSSDKLALISLLLTSFANDQYYRNSEQTINDLKKLVSKIDDKEFLAKAAVYARDKFGMRSITHVLAGELAPYVSGSQFGKRFYDRVITRVDDMTEIMAYYLENKTTKSKPKFPNSLKKGFASAFDRFDGYQLAKYSKGDSQVKLVDIVNLVHPTPTDRNKEALSLLVKGELKNTQTWEAKLSAAGQVAENEEDLSTLKGEAWFDLVSTKKIGYFALLRNLRNIINQSPQSIDLACEMLVDENLIKRSRVLPFRFATAADEISKLSSNTNTRKVIVAINKALDISVCNVPNLGGETLVIVDVSGSMSGRPSEIASLFAAILAKSSNNPDVMSFATTSKYLNYNPGDSVMTIRNSFKFSGGGTNLKSAFLLANKSYDNIIILSDFQTWMGYSTPKDEFNQYKKKYNSNPNVFTWDLKGYGTLQFPENGVYSLAGFSDKVFDIIDILKNDKTTLIKEIEAIEI
jgi:60 kDa SS-A/Ro ribonucleoprotein